MPQIKRVTLFKVPNEADQDVILEQYKKVKQEAQKDGKPYILSLSAGKTKDDPRSKGFNLCAISVFANMDDMNYYDTECAAHKALKAVASDKLVDIMTVIMESTTDSE
ncbi:hypothetical protein TWF696_007470 [Orbilia brochopaga]|uniref:Stress-response A/B barrel domain-containing protein n=1 Tax=Orbilia brochopaga TaxID=3140254 RepID=A0AAV9ULE3_9PEZI